MENNSFEEIWDKLKKFKSAVLTLHSGPDGDSLGSCTAMKYVLEKILKYEKVNLVSYDDLSENLKEMDISKEVEFGKDILDLDLKEFDVLIALDSGDISRLGKRKDSVNLPDSLFIINIDHHNTNNYYGRLNYVDENNLSTCSVLVDLFRKVEVEFDPELSKRLLLGICTDSRFFSIPENNENLKRIIEQAAFLIENGADYSKDILLPINLNLPWKIKMYRAKLIENAKINLEKRYCYSLIDSKTISELDLNLAEVREGIQELQNIKNIDLIWSMAEVDNTIKGSFRCKTDLDVSVIAKELGGGGHKKAAAFILENTSLEDAEKKVLDVVEKFI